jgi:pimeloyl-ACP methyl ester carboxylesterase
MVMHNKTGVIFFIFLLLLQITLSNNTLFKLSYSQNTTKTTATATATANTLNFLNIAASKVKVGDINIGYKKIGKGSPILLIMGYSASMSNWDPTLINDLSKNHTVVIFDNRGIGNTSLGNKDFSIPQFAKDTVGLINALHINKTDVMGFSMGGFIAQEIAVTNPEKINKLVIYASICGGHESTPINQDLTQITFHSKNTTVFYRGLVPLIFPKEFINKYPPGFVDNVAKTFPLNTSMDTLKKQYKAISSWYNTGVCNQLGKINKPVLIMVGTKDVLAPEKNSLLMTEKIPHSWLIRIQEGGHAMMVQYPNIMDPVIEAFLQQI